MRPGDQVGPFVIEKALGSGAMGTVWRARHTETSQRVAIKVVAPGLADNPNTLERFKRESAILKQLKHPNIVRLVAVGRYQGTPFYAMEHVEGESLDHVLTRRGRITWEELIGLGQQLCAALQHVHERGIIHRDLKPSNVMVLADGTVKLTDFGIAKDTDVTALTAANCTVGTASYMSPEQCKGTRDLTSRSDLYSLGVMFFELLTGTKPFQAESPMDMFTQHINNTPERPSRLVLDTPIWLDTLIMQLLEKDPEKRPYNAATVAESLGRVREKAEAQQSAGVDAVRGRVADRKRGAAGLDDADRDAARTLLGKKKKKRKKQTEPFFQKTWFRAAVLLGLLVAIGWVFWWAFLKPPSLDRLYFRARDLMANPDTYDAARDGPLADFLRYYPNQDGAEARQLRQWADEADEGVRERQMYNWREHDLAADTDAEKHARLALDAQDKGDVKAAEKEWAEVRKWKDKQDRDERAWGLVGEKYKRAIDTALAHWKKIEHELNTEHLHKTSYAPQGLEQYAVEATRAENKRNLAKARDHWKALKAEAHRAQDWPWELLADWRLSGLPGPADQKRQPGAER